MIQKIGVCLVTVSLALCNGEAFPASEGSCARSELSKSEIDQCLSNNDKCEVLGTLSERVELHGVVGSAPFEAESTKKSGTQVRLEPSLIYFEIVKPVSVRFAGDEYAKRFLFEIDGHAIKSEFPCVGSEPIWLQRGWYILQIRPGLENPLGERRVFRAVIDPGGGEAAEIKKNGDSEVYPVRQDEEEERIFRKIRQRFSVMMKSMGLTVLSIMVLSLTYVLTS